MTYRGHLSRSEIGLRAPRSRSTNIDASSGGVTAHHAGPAQDVDTSLSGHDRCLALWRGYQRYHMDTHGWSDIAYTMGACQHGYLLAGRGANVRTAANGTSSGNHHWYAICWIGGGDEQPTQDALDAWWVGVQMLRDNGGAADGVNEHSDHKATTCAGNFGDAVKQGEPDDIPTDDGTTPTPTDSEDDEMLKRGDEGDAVAAYQRRLLQWIEQAGRSGDPYDDAKRYGADGDFGPNTEDVVQEFQKAYDLPATGSIGGVTAGILAMYAVNPTSSGGSTGPHGHALRADPELDVAGTSGLGREVAKHLTVTGRLHVEESS